MNTGTVLFYRKRRLNACTESALLKRGKVEFPVKSDAFESKADISRC